MSKFWTWLQGKKTILVAVATIAVTVAGFWYGKITVPQAIQLISFAGVALGLGAKLQRYLPQILVALDGLATALADFKAGQPEAGVQAIEGTAAQLLPAIESGLHITGDPDHVNAVVSAITSQPVTLAATIPSVAGATA